MPKNKVRNKDRAKGDQNSANHDVGASNLTASTPAARVPLSSRSTTGPSNRPIAPPGNFLKWLSIPANTSRKDGSPSSTPPRHLSAYELISKRPPIPIFVEHTQISSGFTGSSSPQMQSFDGTARSRTKAKDTKVETKSELQPAFQPWWAMKPNRWWPCRTFDWIYRFMVAVVRVCWNDQQAFSDVIVSAGFLCLLLVCCYVSLEFFLKALPVVAAQDMADCSVVYVTVPGPIITVSLIGASPTNPAQGTYYFSVINGTTEWLNSIAPPTRFNTLPTATPDMTSFSPVISSLPLTGPTTTSATLAFPSLGPTAPGIVTTLTTSLLILCYSHIFDRELTSSTTETESLLYLSFFLDERHHNQQCAVYDGVYIDYARHAAVYAIRYGDKYIVHGSRTVN
ncbi:hypothetical protein BDW02DRAFT_601261 [Decorospora gaudefroyi]|uniref:Uncharacterized protein n=1 Tax=Decorospora gaudefroyi TaxID=184978 RepID=A0A6A5K1R7_9PLEO|nr:hypothetical protein BDW02DRAFT_601261 [Decorospora gaudefroyi]